VGWVVGVWLGFALCCVALLCGVFVRLHLALFPAGGPFLPSLSVNTYIRAAFISGALRELSVALCRGNASLCRSGAYVATSAAGRAPMRGLAQPSAEVVLACLSPRVWVWGFWFGFALRRVALLCGVFVQLHLALFPAGGPFLPSLSVTPYIRASTCYILLS
jgi:hypothetical protein